MGNRASQEMTREPGNDSVHTIGWGMKELLRMNDTLRDCLMDWAWRLVPDSVKENTVDMTFRVEDNHVWVDFLMEGEDGR